MGFLDKIKNVLESDKNSDIMEKNDDESQIPDESFVDDGEVKLFSNEINGNFKYLDDLIHSGQKEIFLDTDIILDIQEESLFTDKNVYGKDESGIKLDLDGIVIDGRGHSIDGSGKSRVFNIFGKDIIIKNIQFKNSCAYQGGAIKNNYESESKIIDCEFIDNEQVGLCTGGGAAIHNKGSIEIVNSSFINNTASNNGGAIQNKGAMIIENSKFEENTFTGVENFGGVIFVKGGELKIFNSLFRNNSVREDGGVIGITSGSLEIIESRFENNRASNCGGVIYSTGGNILIDNTSFEENTGLVKGGVLYDDGGIIEINSSTFLNNKSSVMGGAIYIESGKIEINDSTLKGNGSQEGGAISSYGNMNLSGSKFLDNTAKSGGAIENYNDLIITNTIFSNNHATESGASIENNYNLKILKSEFINHESNIIMNKNTLNITESILENNCSDTNLIENSQDTADLIISHDKFLNNNSSSGLIHNEGKFCSIKNSLFDGNFSQKEFCANIFNKSELKIQNVKLSSKDKSIFNEGKIFLKDVPSDFEKNIYNNGIIENFNDFKTYDFTYLDNIIHKNDSNTIFLNQDIILGNYEADFYEGGIELDIDNLVIDGNGKIIDGNERSRIFLVTASNIKLKNIIFKNGHSHLNPDNLLNSNGGVIRNQAGNNLIIENCQFLNNASEINGGVIDNWGEIEIIGSKFKNNSSKEEGGVISNNLLEVPQNNAKISINDSVFENNSAINGGVINNNASIRISHSYFEKNTAIYGGVIYNSLLANVEIDNSVFLDNQSKGGSLYLSSGRIKVASNDIREGKGGVIYTTSKNIKILDSSFTNNFAYKNGGAILYKDDIEISNCEFKNNLPDDCSNSIY